MNNTNPDVFIAKFAKRALLLSAASLILAGCKTFKETNHNKTFQNKSLEEASIGSQVVRGPKQDPIETANQRGTVVGSPYIPPSQITYVPVIAKRADNTFVASPGPRPKMKAKRVNAYVPALPLPEFIDVVFGEMLQTPYVTGPEVAARTDVVQLRSSGDIEASAFMELVSSALEEYGVRVVMEDGSFRILDDKTLLSRMPVFVKSRARARTRSDLRPVVQFVEIQAISSNSMLAFLRQAFGTTQKKLVMTSNPSTNYITLTGLPEDVDAALELILELDELNFAGREVRRFTPRYWEVKEITTELKRALETEGWQVSDSASQPRTISLMPVEYSNDLFVFSSSDQAVARVEAWMREFDRPIDGGDTPQIFLYQVKNVDAQLLVDIANDVLEQSGNKGSLSTNLVPDGVPATRETPTQRFGGRPSDDRDIGGGDDDIFTVDPLGNRIVFTGTANDYDRYISLLEQLDTPSPEVLIEVQIAEVTLTDNTNFGMQFFLDKRSGFGNNRTGTTIGTGGLGVGSSGATIAILSGDIDATINAFASNRQVKVLSTPIVTAKSGGSAQIQVGTDIPILTSQGASNVQSQNGSTNIQQSVEYRSTGVLLSIEPIVFSDNRIDLTVSQEVSSSLDSSSGGITSPSISNRSVSTQLSLEDGNTAVLGGLIQENFVRNENGVPVLKDIPIVGSAFSNDTISVDRTELVILITAYVLRGQTDKTQFVNRMRGNIDAALSSEDRLVTLLPKTF